MKALRFHRHGDASVLVYEDVPDPVPPPGEVVVNVRACAVNGLDIFARRGATETDIPLPMITGADISGEVVGRGEGVDILVGARIVVNPRLYCGACRWCLQGEQSGCERYEVIGWHRPGGFAEFVSVPASSCSAISEALSFEAAAAIPVTFTTAWRMLVSRAQVRPGEMVLVLGASGGVASAAVQIARLMGARVAATTSGPLKAAAVADIGAELVIDYRDEDVSARLDEWTGGHGVDVIVQTQGGPTWATSLQQVARMGRIVVCAALQGGSPEEDLGTVAWKQITILGSTGATPLDFAAVVAEIERGKLRPVIDSVFSLSNGADAQRSFERHEHIGKIIVRPDASAGSMPS